MLSATAFAFRFFEIDLLEFLFGGLADRLAIHRVEKLVHCIDELLFFLHCQVQKAMKYDYRVVVHITPLQVRKKKRSVNKWFTKIRGSIPYHNNTILMASKLR